MVTPRENLLAVFRHEVPEWIPLVGYVDRYNQPDQTGMDPALAEQLTDVRSQDEASVVFSRYLGIDVLDALDVPIRVTRRNVTVESHTEGSDTTNIWHTPKGDLREVVRRSEDGRTSYIVEHQVRRPEDLPILAYIFEDEIIELDPDGVENIRRRRVLIDDDGILTLFCPGTPMGMMYRKYSGVEPLAFCHIDAPDALRDLFGIMERDYQERFRLGASLVEADALIGMDDTSTTVVSPAMFEKYNLELTDQRATIAHQAGKLYFHHSCGRIHDLLPLYRRTKLDAVHAFNIPPTGDVTIRDGRRLLGDKITITVGAAPMEVNMDDRVAADTICEMFAGAGVGDHFIIIVAAYPHKTIEQTQFILNECRKYTKLPSRRNATQ